MTNGWSSRAYRFHGWFDFNFPQALTQNQEIKKSQTDHPIPTTTSKDDHLQKALIDAAASLNPESQSTLEDSSEIAESVEPESSKVSSIAATFSSPPLLPPPDFLFLQSETVNSSQIFEIVRMKYRSHNSHSFIHRRF
jgi:hypothetical protein